MVKKSNLTKVTIATAIAATAVVPAVTASAQTTYPDGAYTIDYKASNGTIDMLLPHPAALNIVNGKYIVEFNPGETAMGLVNKLEVEGVNAIVKSGSSSYLKFEFTDLAKTFNVKSNLTIPFGTPPYEPLDYNFTIQLKPETIKAVSTATPAPMPDTTPVSKTVPVYVYKDGTNELSIMQGQYLDSTVTYTEVNGSYTIDLKFLEGQYINNFEFNGQTVAAKSSEVVGKNTVKIYTVKVNNIYDMYNAVVDVTVPNADHKQHIQFQFDGKKNPFTDISKLNNAGKIVGLYSQGIYKESTKFNPAGLVKRSQFALMLQRALQLPEPATTKFKDVSSISDKETADAIKALNAYGVINGVNDTTFDPYGNIRRDQAALMIYRLLKAEGYVAKGSQTPFSDTVKLSDEAKTAIAELNALGIMTGSKGNFNPKNNLTRDQMSKVLFNTLEVLKTLR